MIVVSWLADHNQILLTRSVGGPSLHNDNRGIKITVNFTPIPPSLEAGKKCQANAKAAVVTKISYFHEDIELNVSLVKVIALLKHLLELSHLFNHEAFNKNVPDSFTATYIVQQKVKTLFNSMDWLTSSKCGLKLHCKKALSSSSQLLNTMCITCL